MAIVYHQSLLNHSIKEEKKKTKAKRRRKRIVPRACFQTRPGEQLLFILLGCAGEEHQIVLFSAQIAYAQLLCRGSVCVGTLLQFTLCFLNN